MKTQQDPQLTAYALGELEGPEREEVQQRLANDPGARAFVDEQIKISSKLRQAMACEPPVRLSDHRRNSILTPRRNRRWRIAAITSGLAAAAAITLAVVLPALNLTREQARVGLPLAASNSSIEEAEPLADMATSDELATFNRRLNTPLSTAPLPSALAQPGVPSVSMEGTDKYDMSAMGSAGPTLATSGRAMSRGPMSGPMMRGTGDSGSTMGGMHAHDPGTSATDEAMARHRMMGRRSRNVMGGGYGAMMGGYGAMGGGGQPREAMAAGGAVGHGRYNPSFHTESYDRITDNPFLKVTDNPLSTFSIDVDTASYANVRRFLRSRRLPPPDAVRIEEMVNYFDYEYTPPPASAEMPFAAHVEIGAAPWNSQHRLVRIGLQGFEITRDERPAANLVFLLDVSGSMNRPNKLPLVKQAMRTLVSTLRSDDRVAIAVYAGSSGLVLDSTIDHDEVIDALERLKAGGSTNGGEGIQLAYRVAADNSRPGGINRVILCTDGDFNVGVTDRGKLSRLIEEKAASSVYLSILGFGMGNLKDATMEKLSNVGDGNYGYVDTLSEARKLLAEQVGGTLMTIAKDVKVQVEFNPAAVSSYRLIGYENRLLAKEDFNDDTKDAGDIGAGHTVTALFELVPAGAAREGSPHLEQIDQRIYEIETLLQVADMTAEAQQRYEQELADLRKQRSVLRGAATPAVDPLKYQKQPELNAAAKSQELFTLKLRYKQPDAPKEQGTSKLMEIPMTDSGADFAQTSADFKFASAVAAFGMLLRDSPHKGTTNFDEVLEIGRQGAARDPHGYRAEFLELVGLAKQLKAPYETANEHLIP